MTPLARTLSSMAELIATRHGPLSLTRLGDTGPPLWLLPAAGRHAQDFEAVRGALARDFRTLAVDWPATGATPALDERMRATPALLADMIEDAVSSLTPEPAVLLGHSVGGFAAARLAVERPEAVAGLVLVDCGGLAPLSGPERLFCRLKGHASVVRLFEAAFADYHTARHTPASEAMVARVRRASLGRAYQQTVASLWGHFSDAESQLGRAASRIQCPTLVVWGERDPVLPLRSKGRWVERVVEGANLQVLATGHTPFAEDPEGFCAAVEPFLHSLTPAR